MNLFNVFVSTIFFKDGALCVGINYHMCRLKQEPFQSDLNAIASGLIVPPRELFFDVNTIEKGKI